MLPALRPAKASATSPLPADTDLSALAGKRVLCLLDEDNLRISIKSHALRLAFDLLRRKLSATARSVSAWVVLTAELGDTRRQAYLVPRGWQVVSVPREIVMTITGPRMKANADMDICFLAGSLVLKGQFDAMLIGSGDGDLGVAIARGIRRLQAVPDIYTLSVPGSTSHRIRPSNNPTLFAANILIGRDITRPAESRNKSKVDRVLAG
jgi:hypothetical protein